MKKLKLNLESLKVKSFVTSNVEDIEFEMRATQSNCGTIDSIDVNCGGTGPSDIGCGG